MAKIYLKKNEDIRIRNGHLWVFSNEIRNIEGNPDNGDLVDCFDSNGIFIGTGFFNKNSLIAFRLLTTGRDELRNTFKNRILTANALRKEVYPYRDSYRMVFSESDFLPGLIIDKYNSTCVLQIYSYGMEKNVELITNILTEELGIENIFSKNEQYFRILEGLTPEDRVYSGEMKPEIINDGKIKYRINFGEGHKTGFYFDQCDNREFVEKFIQGKTYLDGFCNSGGFGLHASLAGAGNVTFIDSSSHEIENTKYNFELNGFTNSAEYLTGDIFDVFEKMVAENRRFDIVNIDPPAFAKSKKNLPAAKKGYVKLNRLALGLIKPGGFLCTSSCSFHLKEDEFLKIISSSAIKAGRQVQLIHFNNASLDHPVLPSMEETSYLKFAVLKIIS